jgi:hypothetical protein
MYAPIIRTWFRYRGYVGCVTIVPGIALVCEVVEAREYEDNTQRGNTPSADCWHGRALKFYEKKVVGSWRKGVQLSSHMPFG